MEVKEDGEADSFLGADEVYKSFQTMGRNDASTHGNQRDQRGPSRSPPSGPDLALCLYLDVIVWVVYLVAFMLGASTFFRKIQPG